MESILGGDMAASEEHQKTGAKFFGDLGGFSPTLGIIGTVVGLIHVLENRPTRARDRDRRSLGAFVATLWGVMIANVV